jgi:hypothetical protein
MEFYGDLKIQFDSNAPPEHLKFTTNMKFPNIGREYGKLHW